MDETRNPFAVLPVLCMNCIRRIKFSFRPTLDSFSILADLHGDDPRLSFFANVGEFGLRSSCTGDQLHQRCHNSVPVPSPFGDRPQPGRQVHVVLLRISGGHNPQREKF